MYVCLVVVVVYMLVYVSCVMFHVDDICRENARNNKECDSKAKSPQVGRNGRTEEAGMYVQICLHICSLSSLHTYVQATTHLLDQLYLFLSLLYAHTEVYSIYIYVYLYVMLCHVCER